MAEALLTPCPPFLPSPGEPAVAWKQWIESFKTYILASGLDTVAPDRKRALLVHCLGTEGQRLFKTLTQTDTYDTAVAALGRYFSPRKSVIVERHMFRQRAQHTGETVRQYATALRELASTCNYGALTDEFIRDQLIEKS